jgi:hypothetical protein
MVFSFVQMTSYFLYTLSIQLAFQITIKQFSNISKKTTNLLKVSRDFKNKFS